MQARGARAAKRPRPIRNCIAAFRLLGRCSGRIPAWPYPPPRCFECSRAGKPDRSRANKTGHLDKLPTAICVNGFSFYLASELLRLRANRRAVANVREFLAFNDHAPCAAGHRCGGKVGILLLDFHFPTAHQFFFFSFVRNANLTVVGAVEMWNLAAFARFQSGVENCGKHAVRLPLFSTRRHFHNARFLPRTYTISALGTRSPSRIAKRCKAAFQFCTGMVHFFAMCSKARYSSLRAASGLGNDPRVLITFRSDMFNDSIALVV